jgi:hypothetical protein
MELMLLTEEQAKAVKERGRYGYTDHDINELAVLAGQIEALTHVMIVFLVDKELGREDDEHKELPVFEVLNLLIKPINEFLSEGAPLQETDKA